MVGEEPLCIFSTWPYIKDLLENIEIHEAACETSFRAFIFCNGNAFPSLGITHRANQHPVVDIFIFDVGVVFEVYGSSVFDLPEASSR